MAEQPHDFQAEKTAFLDALQTYCAEIRLKLSESQMDKLAEHYLLVLEANRRFNLTRIVSPADAAAKHYLDSLALLKAPWPDHQREMRVLDVGTGAGFPAIPLSVTCRKWAITAIDGTGKKIQFVNQAARQLKLHRFQAVQARGADIVRRNWQYELILLRAVGKMAAMLDEVAPLIAPGGAVIFYKTAHVTVEEAEQGTHKATSLLLKQVAPFEITLPSPEGPLQRRLYRFERGMDGHEKEEKARKAGQIGHKKHEKHKKGITTAP